MSLEPAERWPRARLALLALAAVSALVAVRQLHSSGAALWRFKPPFVYQPAGLAALCIAGAASLQRSRRRAPLVAAALSLVVFLGNDQRLNSGDTFPATLVPYALVRHGTLSLEAVAPPSAARLLEERGGRRWSHFPIAAGILALPVYLPAALGEGPAGGLPAAEKLAAALMAAASVGFVLAALLRLEAPCWLALLATALYALASPALTTYSQALWQHAPGALAVSAAIWAAVRSRADHRFQWVAGLAAGIAAASRPTDALLAAALLAWTARRGPRAAARFVLAALPPVGLLALYDTVAFGAPWITGYGSEAVAFGTPLLPGILGILVSPTRGLLTFVPWAIAGLAGLALGSRRDGLMASLLAGSVAVLLLHARWHAWWGGWCYGPRLVSDLTPILAVGLAPLGGLPRRWILPPLALAGLAGGYLSWLGAYRAHGPEARAVYEVPDGRAAMEWGRYPLVGALARQR